MRHQLFLLAVLVLLSAAAPALAQVYPSDAIIQQDVEVRSGPSKTFFPTSRLMRGERIIVLRECKESAGWLEIKPPLGSFSWINGKFVTQIPGTRYAVVNADPGRQVPMLPGSTLVNQPPNRESIKLTMGTIVILHDRPLTIDGETWLPVLPHPSEVRYIPVESVRPAAMVTAPNTTTNWTLNPNNNVPANPPFQSASVQRPTGAVSAYGTPNVGNPLPAPPAPAPAAGNLVTTQAPAWTNYGRLRELNLKREDGTPIYVLDDQQGRVVAYVTTNADKSLQQYIGRIMSVYGPKMYRADTAVKFEYVVASHVYVP